VRGDALASYLRTEERECQVEFTRGALETAFAELSDLEAEEKCLI